MKKTTPPKEERSPLPRTGARRTEATTSKFSAAAAQGSLIGAINTLDTMTEQFQTDAGRPLISVATPA